MKTERWSRQDSNEAFYIRNFFVALRWVVPALIFAWVAVSASPMIAQASQREEAVTPVQPKAPKQVELPPPPPMRVVPGFEEGLVALGEVSKDENKDLDKAVKLFLAAPAAAGADGDFSDYAKPFLTYLEKHPKSQWNAGILTNLGLGYLHSGYFKQAIDSWKRAWELGKDAKTVPARMLMDRAGGELVRLQAQLGYSEELEPLMGEIAKRPVGGPATELVQAAKDALWSYQNSPELAYLCGPMALKAVLMTLKMDAKQLEVLEKARSKAPGINLRQLSELADKAKFKHVLVQRSRGQEIPVPSVIHWKFNHYAAVIAKRDGRYEVRDSAFGGTSGLLLTSKAIDENSSGYFLAPADLNGSWRTFSASSDEAKKVIGRINPTQSLPVATMSNDFKISSCPSCSAPPSVIMSPCPICTNPAAIALPHNRPPQMAIANAHSMVVSLNIVDTPVGYEPQKGISALTTITYNQREATQPGSFTFSNLSPKWTHSWMSWIVDDPVSAGVNVHRVAGGGGGHDYINNYSTVTGKFTYGETPDNSMLSRAPFTGTATSYQRALPDGSVENYTLSDGATSFPRRMFLTSVVDPAGNTTTLNYDASFRVTSVVDAMGRSTTFTYGLGSYPLLITQITDPFSRSAQITYDASQRLASITDPIGITSTFSYSAVSPNFIKSMTTPYGTSTFSDMVSSYDANAVNTRSLTLTDPMGFSEWLYYYQNPSIVPATDPAGTIPATMTTDNGYLADRNAYYWDKHAYSLAVNADSCNNPINGDFTKARLIHWLYARDVSPVDTAGRVPGNVKPPLENRTFVNYPAMAAVWATGLLDRPTYVGRVLDDGTTQLTSATYVANNLGHPLTVTDPVGRITKYTYAANNIDLLTVQQLTTAPATYTTLATYSNYNSKHEPQTYVGPDGKTWLYTYNAAGQLLTVKDPNLNITTYNYDASSRLSTIVNANSQTVLTLTYDSKDRVQTKTDSQGYVLTYAYDNLDRVTSITYPDSTTDLYDYNFQSGPLVGTPSLDLRKHTDRLGRITTYNYDANRRLTSVVEPITGGTTRTTSYEYYNNGALKNIIDANNNVTHWEIDIQSRPTSKTYAYGTPSAQTDTYAWETKSSRLKSVTDPLGQVKTYAYKKDDMLASITYTNTVNTTPNVTFNYDTYFPRRTSMVDGTGTTNYNYTAVGTNGGLKLSSIVGPFTNSTVSYTYDAVGRLASQNVTGGNETFGYDAINRLTSHVTPLGTFTYTYLGQTGQTASRSVTNGGTTVTTNWGYDTNTNDRRLLTVTNSQVSRSYTLAYGAGPVNPYDIMSITDTAAGGHPWATQSHSYTYDSVDRLLTATATTPGNNTYVYDKLDNATTWTDSTGTTNPTYNGLNELATWGVKTYTYDNAGNTLSGDGLKTYKWDAENRLVEIGYVGSTAKTNFTYDGLNRRVVVVETAAGGGTTTTRHLWCGTKICQTRDNANAATRRHMLEGELNVTSGQKLVYMPDQLNSVRDVIDATTGTRVASYDYTPYGAVTRSNVTNATDYQFASLFMHPTSTLNFGSYRAHDGATGRWLNRDPIKESGGINLYAYVAANTILRVDPKGLAFGDLLPIPAGYNPNTWNLGQFDEGAPVQRDPVTARAFVSNPDLAGRWRHWDVREDKGKFSGRCPINLRKPWPNVKRPPYDDQSDNDPANNASAWTPPPTDTFTGSLSGVSIPGDIYNPAPALVMPNGQPPLDWY